MVGDVRDNDNETPQETAEALADHAERYVDAAFAERLRGAGRYPESQSGTPIVLDTDIGGDPDDAIAVAVAALNFPELALVVTCDEHKGQRARFARHLLDLCGRSDVPVVAGTDLGNTRYFVIEHLTPHHIPDQPEDLASVVEFCHQASSTVRWVSMGPMSNLAQLVTTEPWLAQKLVVTAMGGAINYRDPNRAEHNIRLDIDAAHTVLASTHQPRLVISDVTFHHDNEITAESDLYHWLARSDAPAWAQLLAAHMDAWFDRFYPGTMQHDPLTLTVALQLPFVDLGLERVAVDDIGRMRYDNEGHEVFLAYDADYPAFNVWLWKQLLTHMK
jgi:inosine-uridine nucleoside N-ribohydrolase